MIQRGDVREGIVLKDVADYGFHFLYKGIVPPAVPVRKECVEKPQRSITGVIIIRKICSERLHFYSYQKAV